MKQVRYKSVLGCLPFLNQKSMSCRVGEVASSIIDGLPPEINMLEGVVKLVAIVQWRACLRVSEVLALSLDSVLPDLTIKVHVLKKGNDIVVDIPEIYHWLRYCKKHNITKLFNVSYSQVYTAYKRVGIQKHVAGNKSFTITHSFRHEKADTLRNQGIDDKVISTLLHHKSLKSQLHYGHTTNKKSTT